MAAASHAVHRQRPFEMNHHGATSGRSKKTMLVVRYRRTESATRSVIAGGDQRRQPPRRVNTGTGGEQSRDAAIVVISRRARYMRARSKSSQSLDLMASVRGQLYVISRASFSSRSGSRYDVLGPICRRAGRSREYRHCQAEAAKQLKSAEAG